MAPAFIPVEIDEEEYKRYVVELKKQASKASPDIAHMKTLIAKTHVNRRAWLNGKSSTELLAFLRAEDNFWLKKVSANFIDAEVLPALQNAWS